MFLRPQESEEGVTQSSDWAEIGKVEILREMQGDFFPGRENAMCGAPVASQAPKRVNVPVGQRGEVELRAKAGEM